MLMVVSQNMYSVYIQTVINHINNRLFLLNAPAFSFKPVVPDTRSTHGMFYVVLYPVCSVVIDHTTFMTI